MKLLHKINHLSFLNSKINQRLKLKTFQSPSRWKKCLNP